MIKKEFELIVPTDDIIDFYNRLWDENAQDRKTVIQLFQNGPDVDVKDFLRQDVGKFMEKDRKIRCYKDEGKSVEFLKEINSTYHTRLGLKPSEKWSDEEWSISSITELCKDEDNGINDFINICKKKTGKNHYSFASKVFNFICPEKYPILDRITVTLLNQYYESLLKKPNRKSRWGDYRAYVEDYSRFLEHLKSEGKIASVENKKRFDVFLWTYGVVIEDYWEALGVIRYSGVEYKT